jgi:hypothetical protein
VRVQLLNWLESPGVKFIAAGTEEVRDNVTTLECVVDGVIIALCGVSEGTSLLASPA